MSRSMIRLLAVSGVAAAAIGMTALPALAHVTVSSPGATQGGFGVLTFRMPNETDNANATELKVQLPADQPLASLLMHIATFDTATGVTQHLVQVEAQVKAELAQFGDATVVQP